MSFFRILEIIGKDGALVLLWEVVSLDKGGEKMAVHLLWNIIPFVIIIATIVIIRKRKKAGVTGIKTAFTPMCLLVSAFVNYLAYWFDVMGIISWAVSIFLLVLSAYFTKYLPQGQT